MQASERAAHPKPEIVENYRDYEPPAEFRKLVEDLLVTVPSNYLAGLKAVVLTNRAALTRDQLKQRVKHRNNRYHLAEAAGAYYEATRSRPATIWIFVDNIMRSVPSWSLRAPFIRYEPLCGYLYHEIGHHIHAVHKPIYEGKENVADDWSRKLSTVFYRRHYWYLLPLLWFFWPFYELSKRIKNMVR